MLNRLPRSTVSHLSPSAEDFQVGDYLFLPQVRDRVLDGAPTQASIVRGGKIVGEVSLSLGALTDDERQILLDGCLINFYRKH